jgi:hypothetical protein
MLAALGLVVLLWACALPSPLRAQQAARAEPGLRARMTEFLNALRDDGPEDTTRRFFPASDQWTYTRTIHLKDGARFVNQWVIPAAQTSLLFGSGEAPPVDPIRCRAETENCGLFCSSASLREAVFF